MLYFVKQNNVCFILLIIYFINTANAYVDVCRGKQISAHVYIWW